MTDALNEAAIAVARDFELAERAADAASAELARLLATTLDQRIASGAPVATGAAFVRHVSRGLAAQIQAREEMILAHGAANKLRDELGVTAYGDSVGCPPAGTLKHPASANVTPLFGAAA